MRISVRGSRRARRSRALLFTVDLRRTGGACTFQEQIDAESDESDGPEFEDLRVAQESEII